MDVIDFPATREGQSPKNVRVSKTGKGTLADVGGSRVVSFLTSTTMQFGDNVVASTLSPVNILCPASPIMLLLDVRLAVSYNGLCDHLHDG